MGELLDDQGSTIRQDHPIRCHSRAYAGHALVVTVRRRPVADIGADPVGWSRRNLLCGARADPESSHQIGAEE